MNINDRRDILLLLLYSPGKSPRPNQPIVGRTRLVKMLFLFKEEALKHFKKGTSINEGNFYDFFAWNFGPFSSQIYDDLNFFELRGFISKSESTEETIPESAAEWERWLSAGLPEADDESYSEYEEQEFKLTPKGEAFVENNLYGELSSKQQKLLQEFRARMESAPLRGILKYVYENYPDLTERSEIREQVLG